MVGRCSKDGSGSLQIPARPLAPCTTKYIVIETSAAEARWFNHYQELLRHFSDWASMWWLPNAPVQRQSEGCVNEESEQMQATHQEPEGMDNSYETESDAYQSCSSECCGSEDHKGGPLRQNAVTSSGRKYFLLDFDEHGQEDDPLVEVQAQTQYVAQCKQAAVNSWPRGRTKTRKLKSPSCWEPLPDESAATTWKSTSQHADGMGPLWEPCGYQSCDWCGNEDVMCNLCDGEVLCEACLIEALQGRDEDESVALDGVTSRGYDKAGQHCEGRTGSKPESEVDNELMDGKCDFCGKPTQLYQAQNYESFMCWSCLTSVGISDSESDSDLDGDAASQLMFPPGKYECQLRGLVSSASRNGQWAVMWLFHRDKGRWEVSVSGERILVKMENIDMSTLRPSPGS